jgi:hypothetical protein
MKPTLVVNPSDDEVFAKFAQLLIDHGAASTEELESRLRALYPRAAAHARELAAEAVKVWYVYREGHWVARGALPYSDEPASGDDDVRPAGRPSIDAGIDQSRRRASEGDGRGEGGA